MNSEAMKRFEDAAEKIACLSSDQQQEFYAKLSESGFTADEVEQIQIAVGLFRLFTDEQFYRAAHTAIGEQLYREFNNVS